MSFRCITVLACLAQTAIATAGSPGITMPNEFEDPSNALDRLFSYFGGVGGFGTEVVGDTVYSGSSLRVWANFQPDPIFNIAGFAVGTSGIGGGAVAVAPGADTFSLTIESPPEGALSLLVTVREDDNADGVIDPGNGDDQWEAGPIMLAPGVNVYNIAASSFVDINEGIGDDAQDFNTTPSMAYILTFETRASFPGGIIEVPVSFHVDHVGFYVGAQEIPSGVTPADLDGDGSVTGADLAILLGAWGACPAPPAVCPADLDGDGSVAGADLALLLGSWG